MSAQTSGRKPKNRRRKVVVGTVGLAVVGAGATFLATKPSAAPDPASPEFAAVVRATGPSPSTGSVSPSPSPSPSASASSTQADQPALTSQQKTDAVKGRARKDGELHVRRAVPHDGVWAAAEALHRSEFKVGSDLIKITSAAQDLTGQYELSWVTPRGANHGGVECTNRIRLTQGAPLSVKPTLLVCWRISSSRSVYAVSTSSTAEPSWKAAVDRINREWKRLAPQR